MKYHSLQHTSLLRFCRCGSRTAGHDTRSTSVRLTLCRHPPLPRPPRRGLPSHPCSPFAFPSRWWRSFSIQPMSPPKAPCSPRCTPTLTVSTCLYTGFMGKSSIMDVSFDKQNVSEQEQTSVQLSQYRQVLKFHLLI